MQTLGTDPRISCTGCPGHMLRQQYALSGRICCTDYMVYTEHVSATLPSGGDFR